MKGDLATWFHASFMALFPRPLCVGLLFLRLWLLYSSSLEKVSLGGVLDRRLYVASSVSSEEDSDSGDERLRRARRNFFFNSSISRCMFLSFLAWETWLFPQAAPIVRTSFDLDSKTGFSSGPTSPNNKFVVCGRKN